MTLCRWMLAPLVLVACRSGEVGTKDRLDQMLDQANKMNTKLDQLIKGGGVVAGAVGAPAQPPARPAGPDPSLVYSVPVEGSAVEGPASAKVTIVEAADFACPYCMRAAATMSQLKEKYGSDVRFVFKHYVVHPEQATTAALASCAAQRQGKAFDYMRQVWDRGWPNGQFKDISEPVLLSIATDMGMDMQRFKTDLGGQECKDLLEADRRTVAQLGVRGTPAFYVNGRFVGGAQPLPSFVSLVDEEIKKADAAIASGQRPEAYYESLVATGKKSL